MTDRTYEEGLRDGLIRARGICNRWERLWQDKVEESPHLYERVIGARWVAADITEELEKADD